MAVEGLSWPIQLEKELEQIRKDKAVAVASENCRRANQLGKLENELLEKMKQGKGPTGAQFSQDPSVLVHADREICEPQVQEGAPLSCGVPVLSNQSRNAPTVPIFSQDPSMLVHVDRGIAGTKPQEGGAKLQEGVRTVVEAPNRPSQLEKGLTGLSFSRNSAVLAYADGGNAGTKAQEGAPLLCDDGTSGRAEGPGLSKQDTRKRRKAKANEEKARQTLSREHSA